MKNENALLLGGLIAFFGFVLLGLVSSQQEKVVLIGGGSCGECSGGNVTTYINETRVSVNNSWENLTDFPPACSLGFAITQLGTWPVCSPFVTLGMLDLYPTTEQFENNLTKYATGQQLANNLTSVGNWSSDKPAYVTGVQLANNNSAQNTTIASLGNYSGENKTIAHIGTCPASQYVSATTQGGVTCSTPATGGSSSFVSNQTYLYLFEDMQYTVATYERLTTAPTRNNTCGWATALNFPSAGSNDGDGGFVLAGATATNLNVTNITWKYDRFCVNMRMPLATNRVDKLGMFKTEATLVSNRTYSGIFFQLNTTASANWFGLVCDQPTCTSQDTGVTADQNPHIYCIYPNSTHHNFYIDGLLKTAVDNTNQPRLNISTIGTWVEARSGTARVQVINWAEFGILRT